MIVLKGEVSNQEKGIVSLSWDNDIDDKWNYKVYRRAISDTNGVKLNEKFKEINGDMYSLEAYDDINTDTMPPEKPIILNNKHSSKNRLFLSYYSYDVGLLYEYYVVGTSKTTGQKSQSNVIEVEVKTGVSHYEYLVMKTENDFDVIDKRGNFIKVESTSLTTQQLHDGYNIIFIKAVDHAGNESECEHIFAYVDTKAEDTVNENVKNQAPIGVRYNNRYRGPQESRKSNGMYSQIRVNLRNIRARLETLEESSKVMTEKPNMSIAEIMMVNETINDISKRIRKVY